MLYDIKFFNIFVLVIFHANSFPFIPKKIETPIYAISPQISSSPALYNKLKTNPIAMRTPKTELHLFPINQIAGNKNAPQLNFFNSLGKPVAYSTSDAST